MKIGIDGLLFTTKFPCGTRNYAEKLVANLARIDKKNEYYIFATKDITVPKSKSFHFIKIKSRLPIFKRQIILPAVAKRYDIDLFHYLEPFGSLFNTHGSIITTVHDYNLGYTYPYIKSFFRRVNGEILRSFTLRRSKYFITDTNNIKKELNNNGYSQKIFNIYLGVDAIFKPAKVGNRKNKYILAMADFAPRKNIKNTLKAFSLIHDRLPKLSIKVITTNQKAKERIYREAKCLKIAGKVDVLENVDDKRLASMYRNAECFAYPSLYEGFGLPILEAMASGCPVITSDFGAMKEISGGAAVLVDPNDPGSISAAIVKLVNNPTFRMSKVKSGINNAKRFSWKNTAKETLNVYNYAYKQLQSE